MAARLSLPFLALSPWVAMDGASTLYAVSGKFALLSTPVLSRRAHKLPVHQSQRVCRLHGALGMFLSLGLAGTCQQKGRRRFHLTCPYLNVLSFFLAFSMGASGTTAIGFWAYLLLKRRQTRGAALLCAADQTVGRRLGRALEKHLWMTPILVLLAACGVAAMGLTGPASWSAPLPRTDSSGRITPYPICSTACSSTAGQ